MGLKPEEFYDYEIGEFWLAWKGFNDKLIYEQAVLRKHAYIIHCSTAHKPVSAAKLWSLPGDTKKVGISDAVRETLRKMKEKEALEKYKEKKKKD